MQKIIDWYFLIVSSVIGLMILSSCTNTSTKMSLNHTGTKTHYHYFCKNAHFKFSVLYVNDADDTNALIIGEQDTIFNILGTNGNNCGLLFCLLDNTDTICVMHNDSHKPLPRVVEKKYHFKFVKIESDKNGYNFDAVGQNYWLFIGLCDQGNYTFNYKRSQSDKRYPYLAPLEWK